MCRDGPGVDPGVDPGGDELAGTIDALRLDMYY
jgi:hypothetical protein